MTLTAPAGWYPGGTDERALRWWDGQQWTDDRQPAVAAEVMATEVPATPTSNGTPGTTSARKASWMRNFGSKARIAELEALVEKHGLRDFGEVDAYRAQVNAEIASARAQWEKALKQLSADENRLKASNRALAAEEDSHRREIVRLRDAAVLQELGVFDYEHPAESSATLAGELDAVRAQIKAAVRTGSATVAATGFMFNNSAAKGRKFVGDMSKILLRAYNAEAENCVKTMRAGNLSAAQQRLTKVAEQIARQGKMIDLQITSYYQQLRLEELAIAARHLQAVKHEKELERERRAELREQRKAEQELAREHERLEKERAHYLQAIAALEANGDVDGAERLREKLVDVDKAIDDVDHRAANIRAGYVYVISNIGAFGEHMVKIGMTRRLDPMDRVNELGDASVPFRFDVHALFFAEDAVGVEAMLHATFAEQRVNKVNLRREYFRVTPAQVLEALHAHHVEIIEYTVEPAAEEYWASAPTT